MTCTATPNHLMTNSFHFPELPRKQKLNDAQVTYIPPVSSTTILSTPVSSTAILSTPVLSTTILSIHYSCFYCMGAVCPTRLKFNVHFGVPSCEMYDVTVNAFIWRIVMHLHPLMSLLEARVLVGLFIACSYPSFLYSATYSVLNTLSTYKYVTFVALVQVKN